MKAEEENSNLSGRLQIILQALYDQDTPFEYTMTGIDKFNDIKCLLVAKQLAYNSTLKSIHIVRKEMLKNPLKIRPAEKKRMSAFE